MRSLEHVDYVESAQVYKIQDCKTEYGAPWVRYTANICLMPNVGRYFAYSLLMGVDQCQNC